GTSNKMDIDDADYKTNSLKKQATKEAGETLFSYFDNELQLSDFIRTYHDKSDTIPVEMEHDVESVFLKLGKVTEESRKINCFSCGYGSCQQFALSVSNGHNRIDNCIYYARNALNNSLTEFDNLFDALNVKINETNSDLKNLHKSSSQLKEITMYTKIISINASIEAAHARESGASFAVVASEMRDLSDKSSNVIHETFENTKNIETSVEHLKQALDDIRLQMHSLLQAQTSEKI
ncbi:MAG: methyl-accepting chemotaxis protein, partial [Oscillospiraceae bacterium]